MTANGKDGRKAHNSGTLVALSAPLLQGTREYVCLDFARQLAAAGDEGEDIGIVLDDALSHSEAFTLGRSEDGSLIVRASGAGGALYGVHSGVACVVGILYRDDL